MSKNDVERLKQLAVIYRKQASEWQNRSAHFEQEVKEKIERERREREQAGLFWDDSRHVDSRSSPADTAPLCAKSFVLSDDGPGPSWTRIFSPFRYGPTSYRSALKTKISAMWVLFFWCPIFFVVGGIIMGSWMFRYPANSRSCGLEYEDLKRQVDTYRQEAHQLSQKVKLYEEEREKHLDGQPGVYWGDFVGNSHCASSGTREYYARLWNVTSDLNAIDTFKSTPATINGVTYISPASCEDRVNLEYSVID
ncbi:hypothetical protein C0995_005856 [Termitomyces sp. Mi166|nr:hypothetical protein C0995_005856 [Termitomyces sp. Mi166\